mgnify:CR=1 FL=1
MMAKEMKLLGNDATGILQQTTAGVSLSPAATKVSRRLLPQSFTNYANSFDALNTRDGTLASISEFRNEFDWPQRMHRLQRRSENDSTHGSRKLGPEIWERAPKPSNLHRCDDRSVEVDLLRAFEGSTRRR